MARKLKIAQAGRGGGPLRHEHPHEASDQHPPGLSLSSRRGQVRQTVRQKIQIRQIEFVGFDACDSEFFQFSPAKPTIDRVLFTNCTQICSNPLNKWLGRVYNAFASWGSFRTPTKGAPPSTSKSLPSVWVPWLHLSVFIWELFF